MVDRVSEVRFPFRKRTTWEALVCATAALLAKFEAVEKRLNALHTTGHRGAGRKDYTEGLTREDVGRLLAEGKCFRCKKPGHMKNECPLGGTGKSASSGSSFKPSSKNE